MTMPCLLSNVKIECSGYTQDASQDAPAISCENVLLEINNNRHLLVKIISIKKSPIGNHNFFFFPGAYRSRDAHRSSRLSHEDP